MKPQELLYLSRADIEKINIPMHEIISSLERMFVEKGKKQVEMPPKPGIHLKKDSFIHAMPAFIPSMKSAGIKWVSGFPENYKKKLPYISGLLILNDVETGIPLSVMDCTWITAKRTGAATAVAAKYLADPASSTVGIIACGVQGRSNLEAISCIFDIKKVAVYDIFPEASRKFATEMGEKFDFPIEITNTPRNAVEDMDIVITSGPIQKEPKPTIEKGWLKKGGFASAVDFDSYWTIASLNEMDKIYTDDVSQMEYYRSIGYFKDTPKPVGDLGELLVKSIMGRESSNERIMTMNLGLALDDMATAPLIYDAAKKSSIGTLLPL